MKEITRNNEQIDKQASKKTYKGNTTGKRENLKSRIETI